MSPAFNVPTLWAEKWSLCFRKRKNEISECGEIVDFVSRRTKTHNTVH